MIDANLNEMVLAMFRSCKTRRELSQALFVALRDSDNTASMVNRIYHQVLSEKDWA